MKIQVLVFMSEIKFNLTPKKSNFLFLLCFYLQNNRLLPTRRLLRQKANVFSSHFISIWSCSTCLGGMVLGETVVLHLENEAKSHLKQYKMQEIRADVSH